MKKTFGLASLAFLVAAVGSAFQNPVARRRVAFSDIAPILFRHCAACHHPGGSGPFSLLAYQDVAKRAAQIASVTKSRFMPPWLPEPGYGHFADEQRLTDEEIGAIQEWASQGAVEGKPGGSPHAPSYSGSWELGKPDLVLELQRPYVLPGSAGQGRDVFRNFVVRVPVEVTRYVRAIELRPSNPKIFHHANILVDRGGLSRSRESEPGAGFEGMDLEIESESFDPDGYFLSWKPGSAPVPGTDGMSWRVDPGTDLVLNLHMRPDGKPEMVQVSLGLYFAAAPPARFPMLLQLQNDIAIDIPAGDKNFVVKDDFTLPLDVEVLAVYPHAHYVGKDVQGYAILPDGKKEWLIRIKDWNLDWQGVFRYAQPLFLPKGSTIRMRLPGRKLSGITADWGRLSAKPILMGPEGWDRKYAFTLGHVWQLPLGPGHAFLSNIHGAAKQIIAGWEFSGITQFESGWPFSPGLNNNASINADVGTPPDVVPGANPYGVSGGQSRNLWFNPAAYMIPAPYKYGNAAYDSLRGPNLFTADWSFSKRFVFAETKARQFRWESFNIFNRTNLANPNGAVDAGAGSAGVITGLSTPMRHMQVGLRLEF